ncbi:hypothetical protein [Pleomorphomonas oryzae]|uniref:hypothetical protein n=1 Tax=Pleomorphomonas oryzae TaxID=261934 RepID=UPI0012ECA37E|nr:hypothetical protein [Pleomorphomonas oryzae]
MARQAETVAEKRILAATALRRFAGAGPGETPYRPLGGKTVVKARPFERTETLINGMEFIRTTRTNQYADRLTGQLNDVATIHFCLQGRRPPTDYQNPLNGI